MATERPPLTHLTFLGFTANAHALRLDFSFDALYEGLESGTLIDDLSALGLELSIFDSSEKKEAIVTALSDAAEGMYGREKRKYGIESNGLAMVVAYIIEAIQAKYWA